MYLFHKKKSDLSINLIKCNKNGCLNGVTMRRSSSVYSEESLKVLKNPYSKSLWYDLRGEIGDESINEIKERNFKKLIKDSTEFKDLVEDFTRSELEYVKELKLYKFFKESNNLNKEEEIILFNNIESIIELSELFLKKTLNAGEFEDILRDQFNRIKIVYKSYYLNFKNQLNLLNKNFKFIEEIFNKTGVKLQDILIRPIARIDEYNLFIKILNKELKFNLKVFNKEEFLIIDKHQIIKDFKLNFKVLNEFKLEVNKSLELSLNFVLKKKNFIRIWKNFIEFDNDSNIYIKSVYSIYFEKILKQENITRLMVDEMKEKIIKSIDLILNFCLNFKKLLNKEILINEEILKFNMKLMRFNHYIILNHYYLLMNWFKELTLNNSNSDDNNKLINEFNTSKKKIKETIRIFCDGEIPIRNLSNSPNNEKTFKINESILVKLFEL